jgi:hypothetical protein
MGSFEGILRFFENKKLHGVTHGEYGAFLGTVSQLKSLAFRSPEPPLLSLLAKSKCDSKQPASFKTFSAVLFNFIVDLLVHYMIWWCIFIHDDSSVFSSGFVFTYFF